MSEELKPCAHCGGRAWVRWSLGDPNGPTPYFVQCDGCEIRTAVYYTEAEAVAAWNRRAGGTVACWHCGVVLESASLKLRCEHCPIECDNEGCNEIGCWQPRPEPPKEEGERNDV